MKHFYAYRLLTLFILLAPGIVLSQLSGNYTIGSGGDYATFSDAANDLNTNGVSGPVTFDVISGSYNEQFALGAISGVSASNIVTFRAQSGSAADVTVSFTAGSSSENYIVQLDNSDYITFRNLSFKATGSSYARVFDLRNNVDQLTIDQCDLSGNATTSSSANYALIYGDDLTGADFVITDNTFTDGSTAAYLRGASSSNRASGLTIENNDISGDLYYGIYLNYFNNSEITQNVLDIRNYALYLQNTEGRLRVENNRLQTRLSYCIYIVGSEGNSDRLRIANNFISNTNTSTTYGLYTNNNSNLDIYHNSVHLTRSSSGYAFYQTGNGNDINVVNNIFANSGGGYATGIRQPAAVNMLDYNNLFTPGNYISYWNNQKVVNLDSLRQVSGKETNSLSVVPHFTSDTDLHSMTPWLDDSGTPLAAVGTDIDGESRDGTSPSIGADEFTADAAVSTPLSGSYMIGASGDYGTVSEAVDDLLIRGISGPVTFNVQSGSYSDQAMLYPIAGSSPDDTVTFQSASGNAGDVTLTYAASGDGDNYVILFKGADHVRFRKMTLTANGSGYARVFAFDGETEDIKLTDNVLNGNNTTSSSDNYALIFSQSDYWTSRLIENNTLNEGSYGINMRGINDNEPSRNTHIRGNTVNGAGYNGIELRYIDGITVSDNTIEARVYGMYILNNDGKLRLLKNQLQVSSSYGMYLSSNEGGNDRGLIANNFVTNTSSSTVYGIYSNTNSNLDIYHNSVHLTRSSGGYAFYQTGNGNDINVVNNIFANSGGGYATGIRQPAAVNMLDYNNLFTPGNYISYWNNQKVVNLDSLRQVSGKETNSLSVVPHFTSDTDLHSMTPWLDDSGTPLAAVGTDIDGESRDGTSPSIGADEFTADAAVSTPLSGSYMIGASGDYGTVSEAVDDLLIRGISGPVTFNVQSGSYSDQAMLYPIAGSSPDDTVTFQSASGNAGDVTLTYAASGDGDNYVILFKGADHVRFRKMTLTANGSGYARVFAFDGETEDIKLTDNVLNGNNTTSSSDNYALIFSQSDYWTSRLIENNTLNEGSYGINMRGINDNEPSRNTHIRGNTVNGAGYNGIELRYIDGITVSDNTIEARVYGMYILNNDGKLRLLKNQLQVSSSYGMYLSSNEGGNDRGLIANNFVTNTSSSTVYGIYSNTNSNLDIYHNSVHLTRSSGGYAFYQTGNGNDINVVNNIFANSGGGYAYQINSGNVIGNLDYNDLYTTGSVLARWNNNDQADLSALQSSSGKEANSASINPGFVSDADLHATTASLDNLGMPLAGVTMDIDGQMRDNGTPDMGADEFDGNNNAPQVIGPLADIQFEENSDRQLVTSRLDTVFSDMDNGDTLSYNTKSDNPKIYASLVGDSLFVSAAGNYQGEGNVMVYGIDRWGLSAVDTIHVMVTEATALDDLTSLYLPTEIALQQNYPNPFNPTTTIRYALPRATHVTITVYNGLGQKVAVLSEGRQEAGYHTVQFNADGMASGVYYYRLRTEHVQQIKRMLLLK